MKQEFRPVELKAVALLVLTQLRCPDCGKFHDWELDSWYYECEWLRSTGTTYCPKTRSLVVVRGYAKYEEIQLSLKAVGNEEEA